MIKGFDKVELYCQAKQRTKYDMSYYNCFPVNFYSKSKETATKWAEGYQNSKPYIKTTDNKFNGAKLVELDHRSEGGRAYKVILTKDDESFMVDFREDQLMDIIRNVGIQAGGYINCEFAFITDTSQNKLVRIGSNEYNEACQNMDTGIKSKKISNFVVGEVYTNKINERGLYLGEYYVSEFEVDLRLKNIVKQKLFLQVYDQQYHNNVTEVEKFVNNADYDKTFKHLNFEFKNSPTFYTVVKTYNIKDLDILISNIKEMFKHTIEDMINAKRNYKISYASPTDKLKFAFMSSEVTCDIDWNLVDRIGRSKNFDLRG